MEVLQQVHKLDQVPYLIGIRICQLNEFVNSLTKFTNSVDRVHKRGHSRSHAYSHLHAVKSAVQKSGRATREFSWRVSLPPLTEYLSSINPPRPDRNKNDRKSPPKPPPNQAPKTTVDAAPSEVHPGGGAKAQ